MTVAQRELYPTFICRISPARAEASSAAIFAHAESSCTGVHLTPLRWTPANCDSAILMSAFGFWRSTSSSIVSTVAAQCSVKSPSRERVAPSMRFSTTGSSPSSLAWLLITRAVETPLPWFIACSCPKRLPSRPVRASP